MSLSTSLRRVMASAAASLTLVAAAPAALAQSAASEPEFADKLPDMCLAFNNTQRRAQPYDEALSVLADKIKSYSGWTELQAGLKTNNYHFDGLCPAKAPPALVVPAPQFRGFAIKLSRPETNEMPSPGIATEVLRNTVGDAMAERVIINSAILSVVKNSENLENPERDFETLALLNTLALAYTQATTITLAVENAVKTDASQALENFYNNLPGMAGDISDLHAAAYSAQKQGRALSNAERHAFRDKVISNFMKNPKVRMQIVQQLGAVVTQQYTEKAAADLGTGKAFIPPARQPLNKEELRQRLDKLPANIGKNADVKNYINYWKQQHALQQDPMIKLEEHIREMTSVIQNNAKEIGEKLKQTPSGSRPQLTPQ